MTHSVRFGFVFVPPLDFPRKVEKFVAESLPRISDVKKVHQNSIAISHCKTCKKGLGISRIKGRHCRGFRRGAGALTLLLLAPLAPLPASAPRTSGRTAGWRISPGIATRITTRITTRIATRISQISKDGVSQSWSRSRSNRATRSESFKKTTRSRFSFYQLESCTEGRYKMGGKDGGHGDKA